jgi:hypothetical protein
MPVAGKYCSKCGRLQPLTAFRRRKGRRNARVARCLDCEGAPSRGSTSPGADTHHKDGTARPRPAYVYVFELVRRCAKNSTGDQACIYVGSTEMTPVGRLEKQREGGRSASRAARSLGVGKLLPNLYESRNPLTSRVDADREERDLAQYLTDEGWCVHGGTGGTPFDRYTRSSNDR